MGAKLIPKPSATKETISASLGAMPLIPVFLVSPYLPSTTNYMLEDIN
jgi:hypothetical protein